jgi:hypothetical protein
MANQPAGRMLAVMVPIRTLPLLAAAVVALGVASACAGTDERPETKPPAYWTVREAESMATVRGQPVHVRACRGLGRARTSKAVVRYQRFACTAGTGLDWESFDSVAVTYVLVPLGPYEGGCSEHALRNVRFVGGGVP